jgi:2-keto-3-deoxy-L-rhamnonate aldolase RhmA
MNKGRALLDRMKDPSAAMVVGGHVFLTDPSISEAMAGYGYDFIWIDGEHGPFDKNTLLSHVVFANEGGAAAFVRVPKNDPDVIKPILEMGIDGIIIPQVKSAEEAKAALSACLYPPRGIRGFGPRRAIKYNAMSMGDYLSDADDSFLRILQIEHVDAVRHIDEIVALDGLDALIIGPMDLSSSIGLLGKPLAPEVVELGVKTIKAAKRHGIPCGVSIGPDATLINAWKKAGVDFISCGDDVSFLQIGAAKTIAAIRKA